MMFGTFTKSQLQGLIVYAGFVLIFAFFAVTLSGSGFLTAQNLSNIVLQTAPATVMAVGLVFVLAAGEIDLSFGAIVALASLVGAITMRLSESWILGVLAGLATGAAAGAINGLMVAYVRLPSFLVTLATMGIIAGAAREISNLQSIPVMSDTFIGIFGGGTLMGVPSLIIWTVAATAIGHVVLRHTRFGAHVLAVGDNARAALVSGIKVARLRVYVMMLSGILGALGGLLYAGRLQAARYTLGETDLMTVIAAVIVGGTALNGGRATIVGALVGSLMMGMLSNGLILMGLSVSWQMIVKGIIVLCAVAVSLRQPRL
ncbi:ABC transporter permease [Aestuariivirga litoralis]|uniref:ABC transporter permease n=1 Tax=Aestuariivirga litoralis TaxID=2650924 RepID=UPI0018C85577|nr:ABC transporter permease [Aestuariivirga litoralis]MBG1233917.1 ABC transporter permease [Aestuariivirga litoralis]